MSDFPKQDTIRVPSVNEIAETIANNYGGVYDPDRWAAMREGMRNLHRDEARAVRELMFTPAPEPDAAEVVEIKRFGFDRPVEFDFTPEGGAAA